MDDAATCPCCKAPCRVEVEPAANVILQDENGDFYTEHRLGSKTYRYAEALSRQQAEIAELRDALAFYGRLCTLQTQPEMA